MSFHRVFSASIVLIFANGVMAQGQDPVSVGFLHKFNANIDNGSEVSIDRWNANVGVPIYKENGKFVALTGNFSIDDYQFSGTFDPWDTVHKFGVGVPISWKVGDKWNWSSVLRAGASYESDAEFNESLTYGVVSSINYKWSENLTIGPGISVFSQLEDDASVFPILSIRWKLSDELALSTGPSEGASDGANIFLRYDVAQNWSLLSGLYYQNNRFRLSENSSASSEGVGEETTLAVYGVAKYFPNEDISISVIGGLSFGNEYNLFNISGDEIIEEDGDAAPFAGLRVSYEF